jgi:tRNA/rRNA methyltransferase
MGLRDLWLVAPKAFPDEVATARASGAADLLVAARVVDTLEEALADTVFSMPR